MKTVIYQGLVAAIGRFGTVEPGAHLQLTEAEFAGVKDEEQFELISRRKPLREIAPVGTPLFDLRLVEWDSNRITQILEGEGKSTLKNIVAAMNSLGCDLIVTEHDNTPIIVDAIVAEAKALKWDSYDRTQRRELGVVETEEEEEDEDEEDEGATDDADETSYDALTAKELRELCLSRELSATGTKADMIARLTILDSDEDGEEEGEGEETPEGEDAE